MDDKLKEFWSVNLEEAKKIAENDKVKKVWPAVFFLHPQANEDRISKLSEVIDPAVNVWDDVKAYPVFFLPKPKNENLQAKILFPRDERTKTLLKNVIDIINKGKDSVKNDANAFKKCLDNNDLFYQLNRTMLGRVFAASKLKSGTVYSGYFAQNSPDLSNLLLLNNDYEFLLDSGGHIKTAVSVKPAKNTVAETSPVETPDSKNKNDFEELIKDLLLKNYNLILTGAPGTGKSFLAKEVARRITGAAEGTPEEKSNIGFVQFHPSFDYTDFVEGLRPVPSKDDSGSIGFALNDGVFKAFCKRALENYLDSKKSEEEIGAEISAKDKIDRFLETAIENQTCFETVSGSQFYIKDVDDKRIFIRISTNEITKDIVAPYAELKKIIAESLTLSKPGDMKNIFKRTHNQQTDSYIFAIYKKIAELKKSAGPTSVTKVALKKFVFIIDEINRGDISKIFGELFYAIDPGYRGEKGQITTQYANLIDKNDSFKDGFFIPENVYIIGTMNDIDRSVESMDFAIRRRFTWKEVEAEDTVSMWDKEIPQFKEKALAVMKRLNTSIVKDAELSSAFHIGPAYFLKLGKYNGDFQILWDLHIMPLLKEYLRGSGDCNAVLAKLKKAYFGTADDDAAPLEAAE